MRSVKSIIKEKKESGALMSLTEFLRNEINKPTEERHIPLEDKPSINDIKINI